MQAAHFRSRVIMPARDIIITAASRRRDDSRFRAPTTRARSFQSTIDECCRGLSTGRYLTYNTSFDEECHAYRARKACSKVAI